MSVLTFAAGLLAAPLVEVAITKLVGQVAPPATQAGALAAIFAPPALIGGYAYWKASDRKTDDDTRSFAQGAIWGSAAYSAVATYVTWAIFRQPDGQTARQPDVAAAARMLPVQTATPTRDLLRWLNLQPMVDGR